MKTDDVYTFNANAFHNPKKIKKITKIFTMSLL